MALTRDPDFPAEIAQLVQAFNVCAEGHQSVNVLHAAANMMIAAINHHTQLKHLGKDAAVSLAQHFARQLPDLVAEQWDRQPQPTDITVPGKAN